MARYIDADKLKRTFASGIRVYDGMCKIADVMHNIENEPTADVVEVVRCGKCKYGDVSTFSLSKDGEEYEGCYCNLKNIVMDIDGYCSSGERRDT